MQEDRQAPNSHSSRGVEAARPTSKDPHQLQKRDDEDEDELSWPYPCCDMWPGM